ncbi:MAG: AAA family ATPase [Actinomycetota bacterium]|nr:AAA family ATPase [Actinomycetota bacterium]
MDSLLCPVLVGRDQELGALRRVVESSAAGRGGVVFVMGEAGVGKSRLVGEASRLAENQGQTVLWGRAVQSESPVTFRPLAEALMAGVRAGKLPDDPELAPFRPALGRLLPQWRTIQQPAQQSLIVVAEAVLRLLRSLGGREGCLLVLEDLHWSDPETLGVVEYLSDNVRREPLLCLATVGSEGPSPARMLAGTLSARRAATVIELGRLGPLNAADMVRACLSTTTVPADVERFVVSRAEGLPFFVEELLGGLLHAGGLVHSNGAWVAVSRLVPTVPLTFAETVRDRLSALSDNERTVLHAAAVLGRRFDWTLLPAVTGLPRDAVLDALRQATQLQLMVADLDAEPAGFRFRHMLTRDAILAELTPPDQAELATRAAAAVEAAHPGLEGGWCELASALHERAGQRARAVDLLHISACRALDSGALASAEATLERALELDPAPGARSSVLETLAEVLVLSGQVDRAFAVAHELLTVLARAEAAPERMAAVDLLLARAAVAAGRWSQADEQLDAARQHVSAERDEANMARIEALAAHVAIGEGRPQEGAEIATGALAAAERADLPAVACEALEVMGRSVRERDLAAAEAAFERARVIAEAHGLALWRVRALHELGTIDLLDTGRLDRLQAAREAAVEAGALATVALVDLHLSAALGARGRPDQGLEAAVRSADLSRRLGLPTLPRALTQIAALHALAGCREEMEAAIQHALGSIPDRPEVLVDIWGRARAILALREADDVAAREALDRAMRVLRDRPTIPFPYRGTWALLCTVHDVEGAPAREQVRNSGTVGIRKIRCFLGYADAVALGQAGRGAQAAATLAAADAELCRYQESDWWRHSGLRLVAQAALRDGWGEPVAWLQEALAWFDNHGHERAAAFCRSLLRRAGVAVPRRGRADAAVPDALRALGITRREMDVLLFVVEGLSNAEIAQRLYLSPRTVEKHVASLLVRTGSRSRTQLAALLAQVGKR